MRESSQKLYEIMFNPNLMAMQKYEAIKSLLEERYQDGYQDGYCGGMRDTDELYMKMFDDDFDDFCIEEW